MINRKVNIIPRTMTIKCPSLSVATGSPPAVLSLKKVRKRPFFIKRIEDSRVNMSPLKYTSPLYLSGSKRGIIMAIPDVINNAENPLDAKYKGATSSLSITRSSQFSDTFSAKNESTDSGVIKNIIPIIKYTTALKRTTA
ncbi:MAG TPA: hypothetical protein PK926_11730 [Spirochaetota bacterium]|nr:hypothetical protein [Spirochaetota bacterium]HPI89030.1 hypothetical protein [Spirochaetota bacterium]HPR48677.1 hypothetical protein [Spirochaetota bacterium]